jgi:hydroxymethylpyrimidine pyrophosphatase-like HAD family hydrolase
MRVLQEHLLPAAVAKQAHDVIKRNALDVWVYSGTDWLVRDADAPHVARERSTVQFPPTVVADFGRALECAVKIVAVSDDRDRMLRCEKEARGVLRAAASAVRSQPYYLDITHPAANKGKVVTMLSRLLSIPRTRIATIGDMPNDVLMFRNSGVSVAMGQADAQVREHAELVTDSNNDEGFAKAMRRLIDHGSARAAKTCAAPLRRRIPLARRRS